MLNQGSPPSSSPHAELLDIQDNVDQLVRQLRRSNPAYGNAIARATLAAISYKLSYLRRALCS